VGGEVKSEATTLIWGQIGGRQKTREIGEPDPKMMVFYGFEN